METLNQPYQQQQYFTSSSPSSSYSSSSSWGGYPSMGSYYPSTTSASTCPACSPSFQKGWPSSAQGYGSQQQQGGYCSYCYPSYSTPYYPSRGFAQQQQPMPGWQTFQQQEELKKESFLKEQPMLTSTTTPTSQEDLYLAELRKSRSLADWKKRASRKTKGPNVMVGSDYEKGKTASLSGVSGGLITAGVAGLLGGALWNKSNLLGTSGTNISGRPAGQVPHFARFRPLTWADASFDDYWTWQTYFDYNRWGREGWAHEKF